MTARLVYVDEVKSSGKGDGFARCVVVDIHNSDKFELKVERIDTPKVGRQYVLTGHYLYKISEGGYPVYDTEKVGKV